MDYYASYKNSKEASLIVEKRTHKLRYKLWQQEYCTAISNYRKNGKKMEEALGRKKEAGLLKNLKKILTVPVIIWLFY